MNQAVLAAVVCAAAAIPAGAFAWDLLDLRPVKPGAEANLDARRRAWDLMETASALQGLVNRKRPQLYTLLVGNDAEFDRFWLARLRSTWLKGDPGADSGDVLEMVDRHRAAVRGLVAWDERVPATTNVAATIAGVEGLLPVRYDPSPTSMYSALAKRFPVKRRLMREDGSPMFDGSRTGSAKNDAYLWAADNYLVPGRANPSLIGHYPDAGWLASPRDVPAERTLLCNRDYFIARRAFFLDVSPWLDESPKDDPGQKPGTDGRTLREVLRRCHALGRGQMIHVGGFTPWDQKYTAHTGHKHGDVETEWHFAEVLSCFNAFMDADAAGLHAMANASFFAHEKVRPVRRQARPTTDGLKAKGFLDAEGRVAAKRYITFYVGDYDSAAWLYQSLPEKWGDPVRGQIPLGWAFNPTLALRFPTGMNYARETATANDFFIAGDSGAGYLNPGSLVPPRAHSGLPSGLKEWEQFNQRHFRPWDLSIVGFVIDGFAPAMTAEVKEAYARFSPDGVVAQKIPALSQVNGTPFLRMGSDLNRHRVAESIERISRETPEEGLHFGIFRTILWTPGDHFELIRALKAARPDIEVVDPFTLFRLAKMSELNRP